MDEDIRQALEHVASGRVLFHTGAWGGKAGYRWRDIDGTGGGVVPWQDVLESLEDRGYIATESRLGPLERRVKITALGIGAFAGLPAVA